MPDSNILQRRGASAMNRPGNSLRQAGSLLAQQLVGGPEPGFLRAPLIRTRCGSQQMRHKLVLATLPCWLLGMWNTGYQINVALATARLPGWRGELLALAGVGSSPDDVLACFLLGVLCFLPLLALIVLVGAFWNGLFAAMRGRPVDTDLLVFAWLLALLLPAGAPPPQVALGVSFGFVFGKHIFGGSGFYPINPIVVTAVFLWLAYPVDVFGPESWLPLSEADRIPSILPPATAGNEAQEPASLLLGVRPGAMGTASVPGIALGAVFLLLTVTVSWRIVTGALLGVASAVTLASTFGDWTMVGTHWFAMGSLLFAIVFIAPDPVAAASTNPGRWLYGLTVGGLAILLGTTNAEAGDPALFAIFISSLIAPLLDAGVVAHNAARRRHRTRTIPDG